jgi:hypothetical protein
MTAPKPWEMAAAGGEEPPQAQARPPSLHPRVPRRVAGRRDEGVPLAAGEVGAAVSKHDDTSPQTDTGRRLANLGLDEWGEMWLDSAATVATIEAEAIASERARLIAAIEALPSTIDRSEVLSLLGLR